MPNMFKSTLASGGGDGADLIVTCSPNFAGQVITCTDGSAYTKTQICPSSSPYEVTFESIPPGTYTISGIISGQTFSTTKTILNFDASLNDIPDGSTVTPTDDIQIWLHCANIWDKNYTTISQVLADASTLQALIASNNAADYMARSTTWASDVAADSSAMSYIGLNDYCADVLLTNSTWSTSICDSTYFESVLTTKVPTMTSNNTPSGQVTASFTYSDPSFAPYKAFDNNSTTSWLANSNKTNEYIGYEFSSNIKVKKATLRCISSGGKYGDYTIQGYDGNDWIDISDSYTYTSAMAGTTQTSYITSNNYFQKFRILFSNVIRVANQGSLGIVQVQFYGRPQT